MFIKQKLNLVKAGQNLQIRDAGHELKNRDNPASKCADGRPTLRAIKLTLK